MCRGFQQNERERLKIKAFYVHLSLPSCSSARKTVPDSLTLHYLPRINGSPLEVNESNIRPDSPAFVTLHRAVCGGNLTKGVVFGSRERVKASEGVRFDIYMGDVKVLKGNFRKDEDDNWKLECRCGLESDDVVDGLVLFKDAEVCVAVEGGRVEEAVVMSDKVEMKKRRRRRERKCFEGKLEEIPEEREEEEEDESDGCCCCCECSDEVAVAGMNGEDCEMDVEVEGVRWAVDVGIWVMCLGVGYLVSKASAKTLRRRRFLV